MKNSTNQPFVSNLQEIRKRAREHIKQGAITSNYQGDRQTAVRILNEALATELVCVLRYKYHYFAAQGIQSESVKDEFLEHANEEQLHADQIAKRIVELGGDPEMNPANLTALSHSEYQKGETLVEMIEEDLIAERIAIDSYREMIHYFSVNDSTTRRVLEEILAKEEEHAEDLASLLLSMDPTKKADVA